MPGQSKNRVGKKLIKKEYEKKCFLSSWPVSSLSLQAFRECQSKEKLLEQGFRSAFREFQQWLVNAKINTAKCFDTPQNLNEASSSLLKIQVAHIKSNAMKHSGTYAAIITGLITIQKCQNSVILIWDRVYETWL